MAQSPRYFPRTPAEVVKELERRFPEPRTAPTDNLADIMFRAGQRSAYLQMRDLYEKDPEFVRSQ